MKTRQPDSSNSKIFFSSLNTLFFNLGFQYWALLVGFFDRGHPSCWCQKQPCTKMTILYFGSTISGLPGRSLRLMRNLKPSLWRIERIIFRLGVLASDPGHHLASFLWRKDVHVLSLSSLYHHYNTTSSDRLSSNISPNLSHSSCSNQSSLLLNHCS